MRVTSARLDDRDDPAPRERVGPDTCPGPGLTGSGLIRVGGLLFGRLDPWLRFTSLASERDALAELSNIAMAKAANSLRQMIQNEVLLAVPSVDIITSAAATLLPNA